MKKLENNTGTNSHVILQPVITLSQMETSEEPLPRLDCNQSDGKTIRSSGPSAPTNTRLFSASCYLVLSLE